METRIRALENENAALRSEIALLRQDLRHTRESLDMLNSNLGRIVWIFGGGLIAAIATWVIGGGLGK